MDFLCLENFGKKIGVTILLYNSYSQTRVRKNMWFFRRCVNLIYLLSQRFKSYALITTKQYANLVSVPWLQN